MHDRFYLCEGGGVSIGVSPTTFGKAPVRFGRISAADCQLLRGIFEPLWGSELFHDVPRALSPQESVREKRAERAVDAFAQTWLLPLPEDDRPAPALLAIPSPRNGYE